ETAAKGGNHAGTPGGSAVATSGMTTAGRRFKNSVPNGRSHRANASSAGDCVRAAVRPSTSPATSPIAIQMWLLIAPAVLLRAPGPPPGTGHYDHRRHKPPQRLISGHSREPPRRDRAARRRSALGRGHERRRAPARGPLERFAE